MKEILFEVCAEVPISEFLPPHSIVADYLRGDEKALRFFSSRSAGRLCEALDAAPRPDSGEVAAAVMSFNRRIDAPEKARENIRRLSEEDALVVMTGQQPGVLTGPLYTIYKALTAVQLSERLSREMGRGVVPAFWAAVDDHDFEEVSTLYTVDANGKPLRMGLPAEMGQDGGSVGSIKLGQGFRPFLNRFLESLPDGGFKGEVEDCLSRAAGNSVTLGDWFSRLMTRLVGQYGLVMVDPSDPALKKLAAPLFRKVLDNPLTVTEMLNRAGDELMDAGYRRQIHKSDDLCPFFLINGRARENVRFRREVFQCGGREFSKADLHVMLEGEPWRFSPNAALRPLISDYLFPVIAYVGGPAEIGYYAQLREVYDYFGLPMPQVQLRKGATFIEPRVRRILEKLRAGPMELRDKGALLDRLIRARHDLMSPSFWDERVAAAGNLLREIKEDVAALDPTLSRALDNTISSVRDSIRRFEGKLMKNLRQREALLRGQIDLAADQLFPCGDLQERSLNIFYFLSVYGWDLLQHVKESLPPGDGSHYFVYIA